MGLTIGQQRALAALPKITGFLSFLFSLVITITIFRDKKKRSKVYHRLIFGMSCADISSSLWLAMSTWPIPKETGVLWAVGNTSSCSFQGFFTQFGISSPLYNVSLSFYYLLAVRYSWRDNHLKKVEPFFHVLPFAWALGTAIAGLFLKIFNSANLWCWIASYPGRNNSMDTNVYRWAFFYGPLWLAIFLVTVNLMLVYAKVSTVLKDSELYLNASRAYRISDDEVFYDQGFSRQHHESSLSSSPDGENSARSRLSLGASIRNSIRGSLAFQQQRHNNRRTLAAKRRQQVFNQCLRYALALYLTWIPLTIVRILQTIEHPPVYVLYVLAAINTPMQGLPNFLVYLYPMLIKAKVRNPQKGFWEWVKISLSPGQAGTSSALRVLVVQQDTNNNNNNDDPPVPVADPKQLTEGVANSKTSRAMIEEEQQTHEMLGDCDMSGDANDETEYYA